MTLAKDNLSRTPFAILHIPHALKVIPHEVRESFILPETEIGIELIRMTDSFTDELFTN